ncbi:HEAT repeat domain-containing protein [Anabaena sp. UHCC 0253]|uniref:HEAT repeat domain-containing protein n=1 Tax=Anabaena sp. UHCC 0253 TaxID=2590019 RepID=UPI001446C334|nr:HEAT repeat domain-containing protein [Anabaena sp. UHCC 0253]MTJ51195.1 HEAT repeat domain-containing protein [Anabaena sp. UHCC 0253]
MVVTTSSPEPILSAESAISALDAEDNQIRYYAAWWLGKHQIQSACAALCQQLQDVRYRTVQGGYPLRRQAARALGQLKNIQAVPALLDALNCDEDEQFREVVIEALGKIGDSTAAFPLLTLLQSGKSQPYEALIEALGELRVIEARPLVEPFLQHSSERVQCAAARYLYLITQKPEYLERIIENLNHENPYLRWAAAFDLGAIGHIQAAEAIVQAKVGNSLKLLNLKRILETVLESDISELEKQQATQTLFQIIDQLLIQL